MEQDHATDGSGMKVRPSQLWLASILAVATLGSIAAWHLSNEGLSASGLYFIAIPGGMAALLALIPGNKANGGINATHGTMIAVLASAIVVREGFICVLLALPLILPVVAMIVHSARKVQEGLNGALLVPLLLLGVSAEGVAYDLPSNAVASETRVVDGSATAVESALESGGELPPVRPLLLRLPFPTPRTFDSTGSEPGDTQVVGFERGAIELIVTESGDGAVKWTVVDDTTPLSGWLTINHIDLAWRNVDGGVELSVEIDYDRVLAPALYFDPLERWGVSEMAEVIADMVEANL